MPPLAPHTSLRTHDVTNQVPPRGDFDRYATDATLQRALAAFATPTEDVAAFGQVCGQERLAQLGHDVNRHLPELVLFDRYGHRLDEVRFHPGYHELFALACEAGVHNAAWTGRTHTTHAALEYLFSQIEAGICCPLTMTYAAVPALRHQPDVAARFVPGLLSSTYDGRFLPPGQKRGLTCGMAMTEKQGGSDVRANTTRAQPVGEAKPGGVWQLTGHKWFCSAPMSDVFLVLAQTDAGLGCFAVPRWLEDGTRNRIHVQRLKDKLGNKSNASSEIEMDGALGYLVGEPGRGVRTILEMVHHTRLDCTIAAASLARAAVVEAVHHARHRVSFGTTLIDHPLMAHVLADLALETSAWTWLSLRVAAAFDRGDAEAAFARIAVAVAKYVTNKRCPTLVAEAMECLGGAGYVEEAPLARLYREAPLNGIWEGSGNVICLDVLRAMHKEPESLRALLSELAEATGQHPAYDTALLALRDALQDPSHLEVRARTLVERMGYLLAACTLLRFAPRAHAEAWCRSRLGGEGGIALGTLPADIDARAIVDDLVGA
jgi:putative acyl-CoA dehydrogenase